ncbi:DUF547 domain-containing protein [soil metagenome]
MKISKNYLNKSFAALMLGGILFSSQSCTLLSSAGLTSKGLPATEVEGDLTSTTANSSVNIDHSAWTALLQKHVSSNGNVDYKGFKNDRAALDSYLKMLSENKPTKKWSVQELLAYYINTYNAYTVDLILDNYPVKSIKDISSPWTKSIIPVGDTNMSLAGIENSLLKKMNDPRFHFAINCASISCPKLRRDAYTAAKINEQLDAAASDFINSNMNEISPGSAQISSIFDWYEKDFTRNGSSVINYINKYSKTKISQGAKVSYKNYDWNLNDVNR